MTGPAVTDVPDVPVLYRDEQLLAVNKPSGLLVHRGWGRDRVVLVDIVARMLGAEKVYPLHRIDRQTSGVVLFALNDVVARELGPRFSEGSVAKQYLALVRGRAPDDGTVDHAIPRRVDGPRVDAITDYRRLATMPTEPRHVSLVEARPRTGRLHQVRRHLKHINCPVIGDSKYGKGVLNREFRDRYGLERLALHAASLSLEHPLDGRPLEIQAPLPENLVEPLVSMGFAPSDWDSPPSRDR